MKVTVIVEYKVFDYRLDLKIRELAKKFGGIEVTAVEVPSVILFFKNIRYLVFDFKSNRMAFTFRDKVKSKRVKATLK